MKKQSSFLAVVAIVPLLIIGVLIISTKEKSNEIKSEEAPTVSKAANSLYLFEANGVADDGNSWVFGPSGGAGFSLPAWLTQNWRKTTNDGRDFEIYPIGSYSHEDISPIGVYPRTSSEETNAESLYDYDRETKHTILSEVLLTNDQDAKIYHLRFKDTGYIVDHFYIDGTLETLKIRFSANEANHHLYYPYILELVNSLSIGLAPRG